MLVSELFYEEELVGITQDDSETTCCFLIIWIQHLMCAWWLTTEPISEALTQTSASVGTRHTRGSHTHTLGNKHLHTQTNENNERKDPVSPSDCINSRTSLGTFLT